MKEVWRPVLDFEEFYEVSNLGRIKSLPRKISRTLRGKPTLCFYKEKIITPFKNMHGYFCLALFNGNTRVMATVHKVVFEAFHGRLPAGKEINHKDAVKTNNSPDNLEACTRAENVRHAIGMGLRKYGPQGQRLLTKHDKEVIKFFYKRGTSGKNGSAEVNRILAKIFNTSMQTIYRYGEN